MFNINYPQLIDLPEQIDVNVLHQEVREIDAVSVVYDHSGKIVVSSEYLNNKLDIKNPESIYGADPRELFWRNKHLANDHVVSSHYEFIATQQKPLTAIAFFRDELLYLSRWLEKDGFIFANGVELNSVNNINLPAIKNLIARYGIDRIECANIFTPFTLSEIEETIIFFLIMGYTQHEIANYFNVSRSYIAKIIAEKLCEKFNVPGSSAKLLKERLIEHNFQHFMPNSQLITATTTIHKKILLDDLKISQFEKDIIRLLMNKFTQQEIATQLNCSRSLVSKVVVQKLTPLFLNTAQESRNLLTKLEEVIL